MAFTVQHIRSGEENRRPRASELVVGQVAVNYNDSTPGVFFRTDTGSVVKAGPVVVGPDAPSPVNWTELSTGEMWLDTTLPNAPTLKVWSGTEWLTVVSTEAIATTFVPPTSSAGLPSGAVWNNGGVLSIVP